MKNVSRRWFIGGAATLGAFQGCRFMSAPFGRDGAARLKFGVVSDIHVIAENVDGGAQGNTRTLKRTFRWFDAQGVDGVIIAGDMADAGLVSQLQCVADAWNAVFPGNRSCLDGRPVEKLFIYGNHDYEGFHYGYSIFGRSSGDLTADHIPVIGLKKAWEEVFEEPYTPIYRKEVKGYSFIGAHWDPVNGSAWSKGPEIAAFLQDCRKSLDPNLPFFYFQHPHPKDTCYGAWAWGHDAGASTKALSAFSNAIAFSGHSHYSLLDERSIWQGAFTSIGTGSLRYAGLPYDEFDSEGGFENTNGNIKNRKGATGKLMSSVSTKEGRNGLLFAVYDDHITITRRDFLHDCDLGPDWVMPLPVAESKPFAFAENAKRFPAPQFAANAQLKVERAQHKAKGKNKKDPPKETPVFNVTIPAAAQTAANRVWRYDVRIEKKDGSLVLTRRVLSPDFHLPLDLAPKSVCVPIPDADLPTDAEFRFAVTPLNCFGHAGQPLTSTYFKV